MRVVRGAGHSNQASADLLSDRCRHGLHHLCHAGPKAAGDRIPVADDDEFRERGGGQRLDCQVREPARAFVQGGPGSPGQPLRGLPAQTVTFNGARMQGPYRGDEALLDLIRRDVRSTSGCRPERPGATVRSERLVAKEDALARRAYGRLATVRTRRDAGRRMAAEAVAACLVDDDAEVYNLTGAAVRENPLTAALNLTALAAEAVAELAAVSEVQPEQVLWSLTASQFEAVDRDLERQRTMQIVYPGSMDGYDWAMTEAKGWIEVAIRSTRGDSAITFYDPVRLAQEVADAMSGPGYFAESTVVVVPAVTREAIEAAIARMARSGFADIG